MNKTKQATMKYSIYVLTICFLLFTACQDRQKENKETGNKQTDTLKTESKQTSADTQSNHGKVRGAGCNN